MLVDIGDICKFITQKIARNSGKLEFLLEIKENAKVHTKLRELSKIENYFEMTIVTRWQIPVVHFYQINCQKLLINFISYNHNN